MRALIISDLHGKLEALQALPTHFDQLWVLGDSCELWAESGRGH